MHRSFLTALSPGTVYFRFGSLSAPNFTDEQLQELCAPDPDKMVSFVAIEANSHGTRIIGVARMEVDPSAEGFEFTIVIADRQQHHGLGKQLMHRLVDEASRRGVKRLYGEVLPSNQGMRRFCKHLGFTESTSPRDSRLCRLELDLREAQAKMNSSQTTTGDAGETSLQKRQVPCRSSGSNQFRQDLAIGAACD